MYKHIFLIKGAVLKRLQFEVHIVALWVIVL
jgi:hypothetical protein